MPELLPWESVELTVFAAAASRIPCRGRPRYEGDSLIRRSGHADGRL